MWSALAISAIVAFGTWFVWPVIQPDEDAAKPADESDAQDSEH